MRPGRPACEPRSGSAGSLCESSGSRAQGLGQTVSAGHDSGTEIRALPSEAQKEDVSVSCQTHEATLEEVEMA